MKNNTEIQSNISEVYESHSPKETKQFAFSLAEKANKGEVYLLDGDLGVGKTVFTKGFAEGLHCKENVVSPTFTILKIYTTGRLPLYHMDVYRLEDPDELHEIGYEEYFYGDGVTLVEWPSRIADFLPKQTITIRISKDLSRGDDYRKIEVIR